MKFIDICAGIGGFRSGLEQAGHECVGYVEIDKFARKSYEAMYDTAGEWTAEDITEVKPDEVPNADLWCFGFPCQDISVAGSQKGLIGERSGIFYSIIELLKGKSPEDRPKWLLIENVKNLLSLHGGREFTEVLSEISEAGYDAEWHLINSKDFGVPQNRERVFIIGLLRGDSSRQLLPITGDGRQAGGKGQKEQKISTILDDRKHQTNKVYSVKGISRTLIAGEGGGIGNGLKTGLYAIPRQMLGGSVPYRVYNSNGISVTLKAEGGGGGAKTGLYAVPKIRKVLSSTQHYSVVDSGGISPTIAACDYKDPQKVTEPTEPTKPTEPTEPLIESVNTPKHNGNFIQNVEGLSRSILARDYKDPQYIAISDDLETIIRGEHFQEYVYSGEGISRTLTARDYKDPEKVAVPCLTPDRINKRQNGRRFKKPGEPMFTLTAQDKHGVLIYNGKEYYIRRLTPKECFRLQGFTDEQFEKAQKVNSNSQLYKQAGNAVTVNVAYLLGKTLLKIEKENEDE